MSQTAVVIKLVDDNHEINHYGEISVPDVEYIEQLTSDYNLGDDVEALYEWYEIGEGESGTDTFFTDDEIVDMFDTGDIIKACEEKGYGCELIERGRICVCIRELY